jgi:hypothetical protein
LCVAALSHTTAEKDTSHGTAAKELENTQQADSKKQAHYTSKRDCEVKEVQSNKSTVEGMNQSYQIYFNEQTVPRRI